MTDQGAKVNTRALALDFLLETVEKGGLQPCGYERHVGEIPVPR